MNPSLEEQVKALELLLKAKQYQNDRLEERIKDLEIELAYYERRLEDEGK